MGDERQIGSQQSATPDEARDTARSSKRFDRWADQLRWPDASLDTALNFTSLARTNGQTRANADKHGQAQAQADHRQTTSTSNARQQKSNRRMLQARSAIQIDRAAKRRFDTLLFELAKHLDDTRSTRFT